MATPSPAYRVSVRALCEFTAKSGDLDFRFTPAPTAQEGSAGHALVQGRRPAHYEREVALSEDVGALRVRGRADGFDPRTRRLEEIKTYRGRLEDQPANHRALHRAQLQTYAAMLCTARDLPRLELALVYLDISSQQESSFAEPVDAQSLRARFTQRCQMFNDWAAREQDHRRRRDEALSELVFPHADFHAGQRHLVEGVERAVRESRPLLAQAPTGTGKTIATLYAMLRAAARHGLDKIFYLTAKTSGRRPAMTALDSLFASSPRLPLRVLEFASRESMCEYPGRACHGQACPLARGFYDRLPAARPAALLESRLDTAQLRRVARAYQVCPYYLAQELVRWCDVVIGDYNHYFDANALLHGLTQAHEWRVGVLVDEAHNLLPRAREMYSAALRPEVFDSGLRACPSQLRSAFTHLHTCWRGLDAGLSGDYQAQDEPPQELLQATRELTLAASELLASAPAEPEGPLQHCYFDARFFNRMSESAGAHALFEVARTGAAATMQTRLTMRNVIPAPHLQPRFAGAAACVLFSATLAPQQFHRDTLGLPESCDFLDVDSPFDADQLQVRIAPRISTRYRDRGASLRPIVELMATQFSHQPGNYLAFFSSFDYLRQVLEALRRRHPQLPTWEQTPRMPQAQRDSFLARFTPDGRGIGFAVLGGTFAEGIDLPNERLIGAFIATLGLPPLTPANQEVAQRMGTRFGAAFEYTYLYPGVQKVVQAAGRVIRSRSDRGFIHLIDDRFNRSEVRALLPRWWRVADAAGI